jgi:hypothetical protein
MTPLYEHNDRYREIFQHHDVEAWRVTFVIRVGTITGTADITVH